MRGGGYYVRYVQVLLRFLPVGLALLRDRRRYLLFGPTRHVDESVHRERAERLTDAMINLGPAFIKVGQVLSTRPDLVPPTYVEAFSSLQDEIPEVSGGDPRTVLEAELDEHVDLESVEALAGGSLAFVYTAEYDGERVALKVRRPGIVPVIQRDLRVIRSLVRWTTPFADEDQRYSMRNVADDFESIIHQELDFEREAAVMVDIAANFEGNDRVVIPTVYPELCTERVVGMAYVPGAKITSEEALTAAGGDATELATLVARTYLQMGLVDGVFHADPHPGNLSVTDDGRLVIYDYGMSQRLTDPEREDLRSLYRSLVRRDVEELLTTLIALEVLDPAVDRTVARRVLELVLENLEGQTGITWRDIVTELFTSLSDLPVRIPPNVMLLVRTGTVGEGVCRTLDPAFDFIDVTRSFLMDRGIVQGEVETALSDLQRDVRTSAPVLARLPARVDDVAGQLQRGDLRIRTDPVRTADADGGVGYAVLASGFVVASALLAFHPAPYEVATLVLALASLLLYARTRRNRDS